MSECLCPPTHPAISSQAPHLCVSNMANDANEDLTLGDTPVSVRFAGSNLHLPEMATDLDPFTAWVSEEGAETVSLVAVFQENYQVSLK